MEKDIKLINFDLILNHLDGFKQKDSIKLKEQIKQILAFDPPYFENENARTVFTRAFLRKIRQTLEEDMTLSEKNNSLFYTESTHDLLKFVFWCADIELIDLNSAFVIMEDIYDCLSLKEISHFFTFMEETFSYSKKPYTNTAFFRISNSMLKKFSIVHDMDIRRRIQMFLTNINYSLSDKAGVNQNSLINPNNVTYYEKENFDIQDNTMEIENWTPAIINRNFYQKFWELQKYLHNPGLLLTEEIEPSALIGTDPNDSDVMEIVDLNTNSQQSTISSKKMFAFCDLINQIVDIFRADPLSSKENSTNIKRYPKYFTKSSLLPIQLKEPYFRKTWLIQVMLCIFSLKNTIKINQKIIYEITEEDKHKLNLLEGKIRNLLKKFVQENEMGDLDSKLQIFLEKEKNWIIWKENGCKKYEKFASTEFQQAYQQAKENLKNNLLHNKLNKNYKYTNKYSDKISKIINETASIFQAQTKFDRGNELFKLLELKKVELSEDPIEPIISYYFDDIIYEIKNPPPRDEDKLINNNIYILRALRVLAKNNINLFYSNQNPNQASNEWRVDEITKRMFKNSGLDWINPADGADMGEVDGKSDLVKDKEKTFEKVEVTSVATKEALKEVKESKEVKDSKEINENKEIPFDGVKEINKEVSREARTKEALKESLRESIKEKEQKEREREKDRENSKETNDMRDNAIIEKDNRERTETKDTKEIKDIRENGRDNGRDNSRDNGRDNKDKEVRDVKEKMERNIPRSDVRGDTRNEVRVDTKTETRGDTRNEIRGGDNRNEIRSDTRNEARGEIKNDIKGDIRNEVRLDNRETRDNRDQRDVRDNRDTREIKERERDVKDRESRDSRDFRDTNREIKDRDIRERDPKDRDNRDRDPRDNRERERDSAKAIDRNSERGQSMSSLNERDKEKERNIGQGNAGGSRHINLAGLGQTKKRSPEHDLKDYENKSTVPKKNKL